MTILDKNRSVQWYEVNNIIPIVGCAVTIAITYGLLMTRVAVMENKIDTLLANQDRLMAKYSDVESRYGTLTLKVRELEIINSLRK